MRPELDSLIEAFLFWKGEPVPLPELCRLLHTPSGEIKQALKTLEEKLAGRGLCLVRTETEAALASSKESAPLIAEAHKEELTRDLGRAALETLAIVLYRAPVSRREIEYVRGVNSTAILRALLIRGLIERTLDETDARVFRYRPTVGLLSLLGITSVDTLPEFEEVNKEIAAFSAEETGKKETKLEEEPEILPDE